MAFGTPKETKEEKQDRKERELLAHFGLDKMENMEYMDAVKKIANGMTGYGLMEAGMKLSMSASTPDRLTVNYLRVIMEQNFIMIRQYDQLISLLKRT
jgi:hypothetical protein